MSLKWKFLLRNWVLVFSLLAVGVASLWGLEGLRRLSRVKLGAYADMHVVDKDRWNLGNLRTDLAQQKVDIRTAIELVQKAAIDVRQFIQNEQNNYGIIDARSAAQHLDEALGALSAPTADLPKALEALNQTHEELISASAGCRIFIERQDQAAGSRLWTTMLIIAGIFVAALIASVISSILQYRSVMLPLARLREGVRRLAAAQFSGTVEARGDKEFVELAGEFNAMAAELEGFYRKLEEQVIAKSRELVRSERLASVGFLAAGVAHEINNPLNIISGYVELSLKRLGAAADESAVGDTLQALRIVRSEAFRCKDITAKLLSLAKGGSEGREPLSLDCMAREVALMTRGLRDYRDCQIEVKFDGPAKVVANATEMKQVLLNLTVNALEAVKTVEGKVWIEGRRKNDWVEVSVRDNGYGIPPESLKHVFEPFYTRRAGVRAPGTGLGLSITHAIVENHGGRIRAESEGRGRGSRFTVELPAVAGEAR